MKTNRMIKLMIILQKKKQNMKKINTKSIKYNKIEYYLKSKNKKINILTKLLCKIIANVKIEAT